MRSRILRRFAFITAIATGGCSSPQSARDAGVDADASIDATMLPDATDSFDRGVDQATDSVSDAFDARDAASDAVDLPDVATSDSPFGDLAPDACVAPSLASPRARCAGMMDRQGPPSSADATMYPFMDSTVVLVNWADLQPTGTDDADNATWRSIDTVLETWHVRLRISAGKNSPPWVLAIGGPGVDITYTDSTTHLPATQHCAAGVGVYDPANNGTAGCTPRFWNPAVQTAWDHLMSLVAARWDGRDNFAEIVDGLCMTIFDEVFFRQHCNAPSTANMVAAGFTGELDNACQQFAVTSYRSHFTRARLSLAANGWDWIDDTGACTPGDLTRTETFVGWAQCQIGDYLSIQHNHLAENDGCMSATYGNAADSCFIAHYTGPRGFQTQSFGVLGGTEADLETTLRNGIDLGANFIELPSSWETVPPATLGTLDAMLRATPHP